MSDNIKLRSQPLVTVLTPVYNGEKYLAECIESVLVQTYKNWEYIIVNNCSTDRTLEIAESYAKKDSRIRIHNNMEFVSAAQNHNIALHQMSPESKYCKFLHSDDWLFPECIMEMVAIAETNPSVGIVGAYGLRGVRVTWDGLPYPSTVVSGREICRRSFLEHLSVFGSPTSLLLRSNLVCNRKRFFNQSNFFFDKEACFEILKNAAFGFVHKVLTYTRMHAESATTFSEGFTTFYVSNLIILSKYGLKYLSHEEYEKCFKRLLKKYYSFLGYSVFRFRGKNFWRFHKNGFKNFGCSFSWKKVLRFSFLELLDILLNPKKAVEIISRKLIKFFENKKVVKHEEEVLGLYQKHTGIR